jgi:NADP-dependent alcohol dehydrogenase
VFKPFEFSCPTRVLVGSGQVAALNRLVPDKARVLVVFGQGSARENGLAEQVRAALPERTVGEFWGVPPNPSVEDMAPIIEQVRASNPDLLLAVGGGSVVDAAKFVAVAAHSDLDPWTIITKGLKLERKVALGAVVSMAGTGAETNSIVAISKRQSHQKLVYINPALRPDFALLDPDLLLSLPTSQLANGVADSMVHILEQYVTYSVGATLQERLAEAALTTLFEIAPELLTGQASPEVRTNFLWAACLAQSGLFSTGVPEDWSTHFIGHELTAHFGVAHARSLTLILPHLYRARLEKKAERLAQFGRRVLGLSGDTRAVAEAAIDRLEQFFQDLGLPTDLRSLGLDEQGLQKILLGLKGARRVRLGERLDITLGDVESLLRKATGLVAQA